MKNFFTWLWTDHLDSEEKTVLIGATVIILMLLNVPIIIFAGPNAAATYTVSLVAIGVFIFFCVLVIYLIKSLISLIKAYKRYRTNYKAEFFNNFKD